MAPSYLVFTPVILHVIISFMSGGCFSYRWKALPDKCTCARIGHPTYSLFSLRGKRIYGSGFLPHPDYTYTFMPCVPGNLYSHKRNCTNVALCKYDTHGYPLVYTDIGEQRDVMCESTDDYKFALIYPITVKSIPISESKVIIECNNNPHAEPVLNLISEDNLIFTLKTYCGCSNQCLPPKRLIATLSDIPGPARVTTAPATTKVGPLSTSAGSTLNLVDLALDILVPCVGTFFLILFCLCLWWQQAAIKKALMRFICCHGCDGYDDMRQEARIERTTENSPLIINQQNYRAIEDPAGKGEIKETVQVEDGLTREQYELLRKDNKPTVI